MVLSFLQLFVPLARYVLIFIVRNNKEIDYDAYMKAKYEDFMRKQAQYGSNPYGNPYGNRYGNGNPYGQKPPYGGSGQSQNDPFAEFASEKQDVDPFADIQDYKAPNGNFTSTEQSSTSGKENLNENTNENSSSSARGNDSDDFFS